jgi:hypothetical protein
MCFVSNAQAEKVGNPNEIVKTGKKADKNQIYESIK